MLMIHRRDVFFSSSGHAYCTPGLFSIIRGVDLNAYGGCSSHNSGNSKRSLLRRSFFPTYKGFIVVQVQLHNEDCDSVCVDTVGSSSQ